MRKQSIGSIITQITPGPNRAALSKMLYDLEMVAICVRDNISDLPQWTSALASAATRLHDRAGGTITVESPTH